MKFWNLAFPPQPQGLYAPVSLHGKKKKLCLIQANYLENRLIGFRGPFVNTILCSQEYDKQENKINRLSMAF